MKSALVATVLLLVSVPAVFSQPPSYRQAYEEIDQRILIRGSRDKPYDPATWPSQEERESGRKRLRDIVTATIQNAVNAEGATSETVSRAASVVQIEQWWVPPPGEPGLPFVHTSTAQGIPTMAAAFAVYSGGFGIPEVSAHLQFYSKLGGRWGLVAEAGEEFKDRIFAVAPLRSPVEGQVWYLAWGMVIGDTGARLKVKLYAFDGFSMRTVWSRDALRGGSVRVERDGSVTLTHIEPPQNGQLVPPMEVIQRLRPTSKGLEP